MKIYFFVIIFFLTGIIFILSYNLKKERSEVTRLTGNQYSLLEDIQLYRMKDSLSVANIRYLQFTKQEFEQHCKEQKKIIDELKVKVKRLKAISTTKIETEYKIDTKLQERIVENDSLNVLKCLEFHDAYLDVSGCMDKERFIGSIISRDTLYQIVYRVPHRFWFIKWGTKGIKQQIVSKNPYNQFVYSEYIELK